jgi:hypothetical protein
MKSETLFLLGLLAVMAALGLPARAQPSPTILNETVTLSADDWAEGSGAGYVVTEDGLRAVGGGATAVYQSPIISAPFPFNALVPSWLSDGTAETALEMRIRTAQTGGDWSHWFDIHAHEDWTLPDSSEVVGEMVLVPAAHETHDLVQYQIIFGAVPGQLLRQLSLTFIDSTAGPTLEEMLAQQAALDAARPPDSTTTFTRPTVISRGVWCIYEECNYTEDLVYSPATHLVVHHTVSSNDSPNWVNTVRAIWDYHTHTLEWGDIGYNYLIDRTGIIYEGHFNQNYLNLDVVGTHAGGANTGTLGAALLGTFTTPDEHHISDTPPPAMLNALANLFAWKADQRNIQIYDASRTATMNWGLPHIMSHRDVYGGTNTLCPGGNAHALLPWLRSAVTQRIGQVTPYTFVSETSSAFTRSNNNWFVTLRGCGWQGQAYYTWSVMDPALSTHWGEWRLTIPEAGNYEIQVYAPYCDTNNSETNGARYEIRHGGVTETAVVSHENNVGLWMSLGVYTLPAGPNTVLRLTDLTTTDSGVGVWFDDVRFRRVGDVIIENLAPANNAWVNEALVEFTWDMTPLALAQNTLIEIAATADFSTLITSQSWPTAVTSFSHTFSQDYPVLYWRVTAQTANGPVTSPVATFRLDATPPQSAVTELRHHVAAGYFDVTWQGSDNLSGVTSYTVEYRPEGSATWTPWLTNVTATTGQFTPPDPTALYWLRSRAADAAGNVAAGGSGDIRTDQAAVIFNPTAQNSAPASASWRNTPTVPFSWQLTEISAVQSSTVEAATDDAFNQIVASDTVFGAATSHALTFAQEYSRLYWRVVVDFTPPLPGLTSTVTSAPTYFGLDMTAPTSGVTAVYTLPHASPIYLITWSGQDNLSGAATYHVDYQAAGDGAWTRWLTATPQHGGVFTPPDPGQIYYFRSQATDHAGNQEAPHATADIGTDQAVVVPHVIMLPLISRQ